MASIFLGELLYFRDQLLFPNATLTRQEYSNVDPSGTSNQAITLQYSPRLSRLEHECGRVNELGQRIIFSGHHPPRNHYGPDSTVLSISFHSCPILRKQFVIGADLFSNVKGKLPVGPNLGRLLERPSIVRERCLNDPCRQKSDERLKIHESASPHEDKPQPSPASLGKGRATRSGMGGERGLRQRNQNRRWRTLAGRYVADRPRARIGPMGRACGELNSFSLAPWWACVKSSVLPR